MYSHMQIVDESRTWPYNGPEGYRAALENESQNWENIPEAIQVRHFSDCNGQMYDPDECITDIYVPVDRAPVEDCVPEFGEHDDHSDCCWLLDNMSGVASDDGYADAYNREAEEMSLGRPLFPNEY